MKVSVSKEVVAIIEAKIVKIFLEIEIEGNIHNDFKNLDYTNL